MQTINDKWKYKLQQLFEILSTMVSLKSAETLSSHCFSSARSRVAHSNMVRLLLWKPSNWHSTYMKLLHFVKSHS